MAISRKQEERALTKPERELVSKSRHPAVQELADKELSSLSKLVRERRDKARDEVQRRRREIRGKAAPKGTEAATSADGNKAKLEVLAAAMQRLNAERTRREQMAAQLSQAELSRHALELKLKSHDDDGAPFNTRHAHRGMRKVTTDRAKDLVRPIELGRLRKASSVSQAKRDSR